MRDIPDNKTIFQALYDGHLSNVDLAHFSPAKTLKLKHNLDLKKLKANIDNSIAEFGLHPWQTKDGIVERYSGFSLCFNPAHIDHLDPHASSLGTPSMKGKEFFYAQYETQTTLKNSYFDSYAFTQRTPAANNGYLGDILNTCKRTIIRSRMMIIDGTHYDDQLISSFQNAKVGDSNFGWHRDEPIYANLRINIPIDGGDEFVFEMENESPYVLLPGFAYSWNTNIPHRVYCRKKTDKKRYGLVIGVSPWFDYRKEDDTWIPNKFCGKKNPLDMLRDGDIFDWLKGSVHE